MTAGAAAAATRRIIVTATGNPWRGDDAVGILVLRALADRLPKGAAVLFDGGCDVPSLVDAWAGFDTAICVDACASTGTPGRIRRIDLATQALPHGGNKGSSHAIGLAEAIAITRALSQAAPRVIVYAVEGAGFDLGAPVTEPVAAAAARVTECILAEVAALRSGA